MWVVTLVSFIISCTFRPSLFSSLKKLCVALGRLRLKTFGLWLKFLQGIEVTTFDGRILWLFWAGFEFHTCFMSDFQTISAASIGIRGKILLNIFGVSWTFGGIGRNISKRAFQQLEKELCAKLIPQLTPKRQDAESCRVHSLIYSPYEHAFSVKQSTIFLSSYLKYYSALQKIVLIITFGKKHFQHIFFFFFLVQ